MTIIKLPLSNNVAAVYNKIANEPYILLDVNNMDYSLIEKINKSSNQIGVIYYAG